MRTGERIGSIKKKGKTKRRQEHVNEKGIVGFRKKKCKKIQTSNSNKYMKTTSCFFMFFQFHAEVLRVSYGGHAHLEFLRKSEEILAALS
jgi:hypothetical protein